MALVWTYPFQNVQVAVDFSPSPPIPNTQMALRRESDQPILVNPTPEGILSYKPLCFLYFRLTDLEEILMKSSMYFKTPGRDMEDMDVPKCQKYRIILEKLP